MKRILQKNIALLLVSTFIVGSVFSMSGGSVEATDSHSKTPFKYVITPKSPEWKNYTPQELKEMLNISIEEAEKMDTKTLLKVVLDYPYLSDIYAFNDPIKALDLLATKFNGLKVLLERENLKDELLKNYMNSSNKIKKLKDKEKITHYAIIKHKYMGSLFGYPKVFNKLSKEEKDTIVVNSKKVSTKMKIRDITKREFNTFGIEFQQVFLGEPGDTQPPQNDQPILEYGTVETPKGNDVAVVEYQELTDQEKATLEFKNDQTYPHATKIRSATYKYNCHSYAWYSQSTSNTWWMDDPSIYMLDNSYVEVGLYPTASGQVMFYDETVGHSAIVHTPGNSFLDMILISKWGEGGLYMHPAYNSPYSAYDGTPTYWKDSREGY